MTVPTLPRLETPFDHLFTDDWWPALDKQFADAVPGDFTYLRHTHPQINVIWLCTDAQRIGRNQKIQRRWVPFAYVEAGMIGRAFFYAPHLLEWVTMYGAVMATISIRWHSGLAASFGALAKVRAMGWVEGNMRNLIAPNSLMYYSETLLLPRETSAYIRGTLPLEAFDWMVYGHPVPEYQPTWGYFPEDIAQPLRDASLSADIFHDVIWRPLGALALRVDQTFPHPLRDNGRLAQLLAATKDEYQLPLRPALQTLVLHEQYLMQSAARI